MSEISDPNDVPPILPAESIEQQLPKVFDFDYLIDPSDQVLADFKTEVTTVIEGLVVPETNRSVSFRFSPIGDTNETFIREISIYDRQRNGLDIIIFANDMTPSICSLTIPRDSTKAPSLQSSDYEHAKEVLQTLTSLEDSEDQTHVQLKNLTAGIVEITTKILAAGEAGIEIHDAFEGPAEIVNPDGTITFKGDDIEKMHEWLPHTELDGLFNSDEHVANSVAAALALLELDPARTLEAEVGDFIGTIGEHTRVTAHKYKLNASNTRAVEEFAGAGFKAHELTITTPVARYEVAIDQMGNVTIEIEDLAATKQVVESKRILASDTEQKEKASEFFLAAMEVHLQSRRERSLKPTIGSIAAIRKILADILPKLKQ